jgi:short chain dehydrogenase
VSPTRSCKLAPAYRALGVDDNQIHDHISPFNTILVDDLGQPQPAEGSMSATARVGLVTGAASGIGRASACLLAAEGAHVTVVDRDRDGGLETLWELGVA